VHEKRRTSCLLGRLRGLDSKSLGYLYSSNWLCVSTSCLFNLLPCLAYRRKFALSRHVFRSPQLCMKGISSLFKVRPSALETTIKSPLPSCNDGLARKVFCLSQSDTRHLHSVRNYMRLTNTFGMLEPR
jgi:hypothetical protein